ncbi:MAG: acyl-CoA synthetase FdrA [Chloroflexota bacterium]
MSAIRVEIRTGAYYDSVILMQLQSSLGSMDGILDTGVVMGTDANKEILAQTGLLVPQVESAAPDDLVIVLRASSDEQAESAMSKIDGLLTRKRASDEQDYRPKSLEMAAEMLPDAHWVLISAPGRYAAGVARDALRHDKHAFLFSDNVTVEDEVELKQMAAERGLLVMGPDCGTAIVNGIGLGFANRVRFGPIGMIAASGTGLQQVSSRIHQLGSGMTHALGTGGRDLSEAVGAITAMQGLELLSRDPETKVIVLVSKPPAISVADKLLKLARKAGKPVVVDFIGYNPPAQKLGNLNFVRTFDEAADLAVKLAKDADAPESMVDISDFNDKQKYLRGLFSGGTLAYEALLILQDYLPLVLSNAPLKKGENVLENSMVSVENTIVDLGEDEFTVGRLHPMMDNTLRIQRLMQEAQDPQVAVIVLDVVLGYGSHPDPAGELAPAIEKAIKLAEQDGRFIKVVAVVVGTDLDPQGMDDQIEQLKAAGAFVETRNDVAIRYVGELIQALSHEEQVMDAKAKPVNLANMKKPLAGINIGLESFAESLVAQEASAIHVEWKPPAGGNEKLAALLERMKTQ